MRKKGTNAVSVAPFMPIDPHFCSMCFVMQWQVHVSRAFLRQDGICVHMPPLASASDAQVIHSFIAGPAPSLIEVRANPGASNGVPVVQSFTSCGAGEWLVADANNSKAIQVCSCNSLSFEGFCS
jgi:hypothetical protein